MPPKTAGAHLGHFARDELGAGRAPGADVESRARARGRLDNDGSAKGYFAGLPGTHEAGQMKKDFQLARYGEYTIHHQPLKSLSSAGDSISHFGETPRDQPAEGGWLDSPQFASLGGSLSDRLEGGPGWGLPPLDVSMTPRSLAHLGTPLYSPLSIGTPSMQPLDTRSPLAPPNQLSVHIPLSGSLNSARGLLHTPRSLSSRGTPRSVASPASGRRRQTSPYHDAPDSGIVLKDVESEATDQKQRKTYIGRKPASKWKKLEVPDFYLKTLEGCSTGHIPSAFFEKKPAISTAGNTQVLAFHRNPLPLDPDHKSASKEYFAPKGFGKLHCEICSRYFINEELLAQHCQGTVHQYKEAKARGIKRPPPPIPKEYNVLDCGEFDEAYHALRSESSDSEHLSEDDSSENKVAARREQLRAGHNYGKEDEKFLLAQRKNKLKFFEFVRDHLEREVSEKVMTKDVEAQLKEEMEEAMDNRRMVKVEKLSKLLQNQRLNRAEQSKAGDPEEEPEDQEQLAKERARAAQMQDIRVLYLSKCKELNILPKASIVTRQRKDGFDLKHYGAGNATVQALAPSLRTMKNLQYMSLRDNRMEESGSAEMIDALRDNVDVLVLDLSTNHIGRLGMMALSRTIPTLLSLKKLDISKNKLMDSEIITLMNYIQEAISLEELNLSHNNIASNGSVAIGDAINHCEKLVNLDLSWNAIRGKGVATIGEALATNSTLQNLNLEWNGLGGSKHFDSWANAFELNSTLLSLNLSHNGLDERNCLIICENLKFNTILDRLLLNDNPLGPVGAKLVFKLMDSFGAERQLRFEKCNFDTKSKQCDFNPSECTGTEFSLDLSAPYDRSIALSLVRIAGKNIVDQWRNPKHDRGQIDASKYMNRGDLLPREGTLEFTYVQFVRKATKENVMNANTFNKLSAMVSAADRSEVDRITQVQKVAEEIDLTCEQLAKMMQEANLSSRSKITLILNLFSRIVDREEFYVVEEELTKEELAKLRNELGPMWSYSDDNPTGHYKLRLEVHVADMSEHHICVHIFARFKRC